MVGRSWRRCAGPIVVVALAASVAPLRGQGPDQRPPDRPVTRLAGSGAAGGITQTAPPPQRPGTPPAVPATQLDDRSRADLDGPRLVSLTLSKPQPLVSLLQLLVNGTGFSLVADEGVSGSFVGELNNLTMRQALEAVLFPRDLDYDVQGTLIRVFPRRTSTRLFDVNYLNLRRTWQRGVRSSVAIAGGVPPAADSSSATESNFFEELTKGVETLLSSSGRLHVDRGAGLVQVTDFADRLDRVAIYVEAAQLRATRQVRIDARVFEVTLSSAAATSIDWKLVASRSGAVAPEPGRAAAGMTVDDVERVIKAIQEQGAVHMIAAPFTIAMNNEPAVMRVGTEQVYFVSSSHERESGGTDRTRLPGSVMEGLTLTVTPQVASDGIVQLAISPTYAEKTGQAKSGGQIVPVLRISEADTLARVRGGETVVISGFQQERSRTRPGSGFGGLFGAQTHETVRSELVILLTPVVVAPGAPR